MIYGWIILALWVAIGILNLTREKIDKLQYAYVWLLLTIKLLVDALGI